MFEIGNESDPPVIRFSCARGVSRLDDQARAAEPERKLLSAVTIQPEPMRD